MQQSRLLFRREAFDEINQLGLHRFGTVHLLKKLNKADLQGIADQLEVFHRDAFVKKLNIPQKLWDKPQSFASRLVVTPRSSRK